LRKLIQSLRRRISNAFLRTPTAEDPAKDIELVLNRTVAIEDELERSSYQLSIAKKAASAFNA